MTTAFLDELRWRGQLHQATDEQALASHLAGGVRRAYVGFDPTADSLTIGNLVGIMALARWQRCGHTPVVVMGGGTGLIGDPSGKSAERQLLTKERVEENVRAQRSIFERVLDFAPGRATSPLVVNNLDWLSTLSYLDALRDVGKHFSVNMMVQKDSVRERLHNRDQGISYTEFSYMILQAYDFAWLHEHQGVTLQMGGSDQWGNIVAGIDLIRKHAAATNAEPHAPAFGLTWPLVTKADGTKFGKTESGAIWLTSPRPGESSPNRTSAYAYYQFWLNAADADVVRFLKTFTFLSREEIASLEESARTNPGAREAQRALAREATTILHGKREADHAEAAARALFSGDIAGLPVAMLTEVFASAPASDHDKSHLGGEGMGLVDLLVATQLASSKREAREFLQNGSVTLNGRRVGPDDRATSSDLLHASMIALRRGKKHWHLTRWK